MEPASEIAAFEARQLRTCPACLRSLRQARAVVTSEVVVEIELDCPECGRVSVEVASAAGFAWFVAEAEAVRRTIGVAADVLARPELTVSAPAGRLTVWNLESLIAQG